MLRNLDFHSQFFVYVRKFLKNSDLVKNYNNLWENHKSKNIFELFLHMYTTLQKIE